MILTVVLIGLARLETAGLAARSEAPGAGDELNLPAALDIGGGERIVGNADNLLAIGDAGELFAGLDNLIALVVGQFQAGDAGLHGLDDEITGGPFQFWRDGQRRGADVIARAAFDFGA